MRLVPAASAVLLAVSLLALFVLPPGRWTQTVREIAAAALFVENWQLASDSVDYAARGNMTSVVQHFWSLSIQGQVFLLWPVMVAVVALACRGRSAQLRARVTLVLLALFAASLAYSIELTIANQPLAYFHTMTRLWEFAAGGLLALHGRRLALRPAGRLAAGWIGVVGLAACGALLPVSSVFPGFAALWPIGCAALILVAGQTGSRIGADRLLSSRAGQYLGDLSYALYLWHWPLLVLYLVNTGQERVNLTQGAAIIALSVLLAALTYHLVERPVLRLPPGRHTGYRAAAAGTGVVLAVVTAWHVLGVVSVRSAGEAGPVTHPGAVALVSGPVGPAPLLPPSVAVSEDWVRIERWDCRPMAAFPMDVCTQPMSPADRLVTSGPQPHEDESTVAGTETQPDPPAGPAPTKRILVVGDSHAQQLTAALLPIAAQQNWQISVIVRGACPFSTASEVAPDDGDCLAWNAAAAEEILTLRPDIVVTLASRDVRVGVTEQTPPGFVEAWRRLDDAGIRVLALRDNPRFDRSIPDCVQTHPEDVSVCGVSRADVYRPAPPWTTLPDVPGNVSFVDIADAVCDPETCLPVIGNVLVYLDDNHLTATYSASMADLIADHVLAGVGS